MIPNETIKNISILKSKGKICGENITIQPVKTHKQNVSIAKNLLGKLSGFISTQDKMKAIKAILNAKIN